MTDKSRFLKKKKKLCPNLNQVQNKVFGYFIEFGLQGFFEIIRNDTLWQFLAFIAGKIYKKIILSSNLGQTGQNGPPN